LSDFQSVMDAIAQVVGGTQPDATNRPRWFSGRDSGDGTGLLPGGTYPVFTGCYSAPPDAIEDYPVGVVLPGPFQIRGADGRENYWQGSELNVDDLSVWIIVARQDSQTTFGNLMPYRDLMPAAFAAKMTAFSTVNILQAMVVSGRPKALKWGDITYDAIEFVVRVSRMIPRTYTA
jgi:hypothetical protein